MNFEERTFKPKACCFFGHRDLFDNESALYNLLIEKVEQLIVDGFIEFLFGGYGAFDALAHRVASALKIKYPHIKTVYVQAYYKHRSQKMQYLREHYDDVYYPGLESVPQKFAITYRNRAMVDAVEFCIFYVTRNHGGAYDAFKYAGKAGKAVLNLIDLIVR